MSVLPENLAELSRDLKSVLELINLFKQLESYAAVDITPATDFELKALEIRDSIRSCRVQMKIASGAIIVYIVGRFEFFVRRHFEITSEEIAKKFSSFDKLPKSMKTGLIKYTAEVINAPQKFGYDQIEIRAFISILAANIIASSPITTINSECLSITSSNMRSNIMKELFGRIDLGDVWSELAKTTPMRLHFETKNDSDIKERSTRALDELIELRNSISHPDGTPTFPGLEIVESHIQFLGVLANSLHETSMVHISSISA